MALAVSPIGEGDLPRVAEFLHAEFPHEPRESRQTWLRALYSPWGKDQPNWGFMATDGDSVVGVYIAHYSTQQIDGRPESFCNLGVWHVVPEFRVQSLPLVRAMLGQEGYHFTDFTPAENVVAINERLGFQRLDTRGFIVPCLPWPTWPGGARLVSDPGQVERLLDGEDLQRFHDHRAAGGLRHVVIDEGGRRCYVAMRPDRHRNLPALTLLYVSDPELLRRHAARFARHLLLHLRAVAYIAELRLIGFRPRFGVELSEPQVRMFRSERLRPEQITYLYSEMVCVPE